MVKLETDKEAYEKLKELGIATAKCWNEVNWLRMQQFKEGKRVDFNETEKKVYAKYKTILKVNAQQVMRKNSEDWRSFFTLVEKKKEGKLPSWFKPRPPGYWKEKGKYKLILIIRNDRYVVDEEGRKIHLKDFHLTIKFKGKLKWKGEQGRLEIICDETRKLWYAHIPVKLERNAQKSNLTASADLGIVNLATVFVEDGLWCLFKGGSVLSQYEHYGKKIQITQKILARHKQSRRSRKLRLLYEKRSRSLKHALNSMVRKVMELLKDKGVGKLVVEYPQGIAKHRGNKLTVNFWNYRYVVKRLKEVGEEVGIDVVEVDEAYTSKACSLCEEAHESGRVKRGLFKCPRTGEAINADLNGAVNILHIPESLGTKSRGQLLVRDRGNWLKTQSAVYRWTNGAGWVQQAPASCEVMKMRAVNHKPVNRPKGTLTLQGGEEVR